MAVRVNYPARARPSWKFWDISVDIPGLIAITQERGILSVQKEISDSTWWLPSSFKIPWISGIAVSH